MPQTVLQSQAVPTNARVRRAPPSQPNQRLHAQQKPVAPPAELRLSARVDFHRVTDRTTEYRVTEGISDSLSKRHRHRQAVQLLYRRHDAGGLEWVDLARDLYLETLA